jgi:hypothetical protein
VSDSPIEKQLLRFLQSRRPEAMCVSGAWGIGKTYLWTDIVLPQSAHLPSFNGVPDDLGSGEAHYQQYSYVSLFGVNSIAELKRAIFEMRRSRGSWWRRLTPEDVTSNWKRNLDIVGRVGSAVMKWGNAADIIAARLADSIWNQVICLDDLERKGSALSMREVLGYVSHLKEERRCKVLVLTNSTELVDADKRQYDEYHEKVFDRTMILAPTPEDCCKIAGADDALSGRVAALGISNIRVVKKIQALIEEVKPLLTEFHPSVTQQAINTLTLAGWMRYTKGAPPFEFLDRRVQVSVARTIGRSALSNAEPVAQQDAKWVDQIDAYGYPYVEPDTLDRALNDATVNGYMDDALIKAAARGLHRDAAKADSAQKRDEAWRLFHGSFRDNADEVVHAYVDSYGDNMKFMRAGELDPAVGILRSLGHDDKADALIELYRATHAGDVRALDPKLQRRHDEPIQDVKLYGILASEHAAAVGPADPVAALRRLYKGGGGDQDDYEIAMQVTAEQLADAFDQLEGDELNKFIRACLQYENTIAYGLDVPVIARRTKEALRIIGHRSELNRLRVRKFGIDLNEPAQDDAG